MLFVLSLLLIPFTAVLKKSEFALRSGLTRGVLRACYRAAGAGTWKALGAYVCDAPPSDLYPNTIRKEGRKEGSKKEAKTGPAVVLY